LLRKHGYPVPAARLSATLPDGSPNQHTRFTNVPNWMVIYIITTTRSKDFFGAVAGEKEDFCKGSFARTSFTLF
jgi:hypothetical protein